MPQLTWILPIGTHVVSRVEIRDARGSVLCPAGAVGRVVEAPLDGTHVYRVELPDGRVVALSRKSLALRKHVTDEDLAWVGAVDLRRFVIYRCVIGSQAYGLAA